MRFARSLRWAPVLLGFTLLGSCDRSVSPEPDEGILVGRWAGGLWVGDARAVVANTQDGVILTILGSRPPGGLHADEVLSARILYTGPGLYELAPEDVMFTELIGGDVVSAEYHGTGTPAGMLRIASFDQSAGVVTGELSFRATTRSANASYGETARLEDGTFRALTVPTQF